MDFYSYLWLREDGTPYYVGKGSGNRAFVLHCKKGGRRLYPPQDRSRILVFPMLNEAEATESEIAIIALFGRKDLGTGCLRNFTDGGEGQRGLIHTTEAKAKMSQAHQGHPSYITREGVEKMRQTKLAKGTLRGNHNALGTKRTEAQRLAISEQLKRTWASHPERREKTRLEMMGNKHAKGAIA